MGTSNNERERANQSAELNWTGIRSEQGRVPLKASSVGLWASACCVWLRLHRGMGWRGVSPEVKLGH
jgi:hypothetical protein